MERYAGGQKRKTRSDPAKPPVNIDSILKATADEYGVKAEQFCGFRSRAGGRDVAAMLCRRWTGTTLRALSETFGLSHPDSASDLIKRGKQRTESSQEVSRRVQRIERRLGLNPESRV